MVKKQATITISGEVQDAGFRGKVMRVGQKAGLTGYIENLPDGSVRVISEGEEESINDFVKKLDIHDDDIDVENIDVEWSDATGEFKWFEVKYSDLGAEMFQGFATAGKKLSAVSQKVEESIQATKEVSHKVEESIQATKEVGQDVRVVGENIDVLTASTKENFNELGDKYHVISENMGAMNKNIEKMVDALTLLVKEHVEQGKQ